jgi:4-amino-4-deoxy-L-arabinose transferase-like glycosyltransferase
VLALDSTATGSVRRAWPWLALGLIVGGAFAAWVLALPHDPPCCFLDESSTGYNAWLIAHTGKDEFGAHLPLYFKVSGEFRSPVQIYLMAGLFKVFGAHALLGRYLTRLAVFCAVGLVAWLAYRISRRRIVGAAVALLGLTTPQLYEVSRLGTEGPLIALPISGFLLLVWELSQRPRWRPGAGVVLALPLAVAAYTYPIGRLLAPAFALLLGLFWTRRRWPGIVSAWVTLAVSMAPVIAFAGRHPGALGRRAGEVGWYHHGMAVGDVLGTFLRHLAGNVGPGPVLFTGDPNIRHHVHEFGAAFVPLAVLTLLGLGLVILRSRRDPWWRFVALAALASLVPASLTVDPFHTPRLILVPLFALILAVPALTWLVKRPRAFARAGLAAALVVTAVQAAIFTHVFVRDGDTADRRAAFNADFVPAFAAAERTGVRPIWLLDYAYIHGFWRGVLDGIPRSQLVHWVRPPQIDRYADYGQPAQAVQFAPPVGAVAVGPSAACPTCRSLYEGFEFNAWVQSREPGQ